MNTFSTLNLFKPLIDTALFLLLIAGGVWLLGHISVGLTLWVKSLPYFSHRKSAANQITVPSEGAMNFWIGNNEIKFGMLFLLGSTLSYCSIWIVAVMGGGYGAGIVMALMVFFSLLLASFGLLVVIIGIYQAMANAIRKHRRAVHASTLVMMCLTAFLFVWINKAAHVSSSKGPLGEVIKITAYGWPCPINQVSSAMTSYGPWSQDRPGLLGSGVARLVNTSPAILFCYTLICAWRLLGKRMYKGTKEI